MFEVVLLYVLNLRTVAEIYMETSVLNKLRSRLCRSLAFVQRALAVYTCGAPFFSLAKGKRETEEG